MLIEFLLLGLIGENVRGYYSGKGKSGGGKFIGGKIEGDDQKRFENLRKDAKAGDADAQKQMQEMAKEAKQRDAAQGSTLSAEKIHSVVRNEENRIQKEEVEHAVLVTPDGKVQTWTDNKRSTAKIPARLVPSMNGATFSHNHPSNKSLSAADWTTAISTNTAEMRAVGGNGAVYSLKIKNWKDRGTLYTENGGYKWDVERVRSRQSQAIKNNHSNISNDIRVTCGKNEPSKGGYSDQEIRLLNQYHAHAVNLKLSQTQLSKDLGLEYSARFNAQQQKEWASVKGYFGL